MRTRLVGSAISPFIGHARGRRADTGDTVRHQEGQNNLDPAQSFTGKENIALINEGQNWADDQRDLEGAAWNSVSNSGLEEFDWLHRLK